MVDTNCLDTCGGAELKSAASWVIAWADPCWSQRHKTRQIPGLVERFTEATGGLFMKHLKKTQFLLLVGVLTISSQFTPLLHGQLVSGSITGQVTDPSGATVANA